MKITNRMIAVTNRKMNGTTRGPGERAEAQRSGSDPRKPELNSPRNARESGTCKVGDVMTREVTSYRPQDTLAAVALAMNRADCRFLPVVDGSGRPVGVITDGDVCLLGANEKRPLREISVNEVMNQPAATCRSDMDIVEVLRMMRSQRIRHVPVVGTDGGLIGIVSLTDLVLCAEESEDRPSAVRHELVAVLREIAQKNLGGRSVREHPFIED